MNNESWVRTHTHTNTHPSLLSPSISRSTELPFSAVAPKHKLPRAYCSTWQASQKTGKESKKKERTKKDKWSSAPHRVHAETNNNFAQLTNGGSRWATRRLCFTSQTRCLANKRRPCSRWNESQRATREHLDFWTGDFIHIGQRRMSDVRETDTEGEN